MVTMNGMRQLGRWVFRSFHGQEAWTPRRQRPQGVAPNGMDEMQPCAPGPHPPLQPRTHPYMFQLTRFVPAATRNAELVQPRDPPARHRVLHGWPALESKLVGILLLGIYAHYGYPEGPTITLGAAMSKKAEGNEKTMPWQGLVTTSSSSKTTDCLLEINGTIQSTTQEQRIHRRRDQDRRRRSVINGTTDRRTRSEVSRPQTASNMKQEWCDLIFGGGNT